MMGLLAKVSVAIDSVILAYNATLDDFEFLQSSNRALHVTDGVFASGPIYQDATYKYFGEAMPGTALTDASWRVSRMRLDNSQIQWANVDPDGNANFNNVYTDLATVAAMSFS